MSLTGTQLSTLLKTYLHNDAGISAADLLLYLTLGQQKMVRDSPTTLSTKQANISLTSGDTTREYDLPADFYAMQAVWLPTMGYKLSPMLDAEFIDTVERLPTIPTGPPRDYIIIGFDESLATTSSGGAQIPNMTTVERLAISSPSLGLMVYDTTLNQFMGYGYNGWQYLSTGCEAS